MHSAWKRKSVENSSEATTFGVLDTMEAASGISLCQISDSYELPSDPVSAVAFDANGQMLAVCCAPQDAKMSLVLHILDARARHMTVRVVALHAIAAEGAHDDGEELCVSV